MDSENGANMATTVATVDETPARRPSTRNDRARYSDVGTGATPTRRILDDARMQDVARRVLRGETTANIAAAIGLSVPQTRRLLASPDMQEVYQDVSRELYQDVDAVIVDEKINAAVRREALQARAMTVLAETYAIIQGKYDQSVAGGAPVSGQTLRAAVEAVKVGMQVDARAAKGGDGSPLVKVDIHMTRQDAGMVKGAIDESGVDLSDLLFGAPAIEGEVVDEAPAPVEPDVAPE